MERVHGVVQHYAWGDHTFIPQLLGDEPDGTPWAELWLGTHPKAPSTLDDGSPLSDLTGELPYLLKVLAAGRPLSLQTHPDAEQARAGFARGAYPDPYPKPELLCALTPFEALCGLRPTERTIDLLDQLGAIQLCDAVREAGPGDALERLYRGEIDPMPVVAACEGSERDEARWVRRLDRRYPGEPSVAATLLLNLVVLRPGQAVRLDAGNLHAYLSGCGIELMGPSDNVIRGGLTDKHVDVDELLDVVDRTPLERPVLPDGVQFDLPAASVALVRLEAGEQRLAAGGELSIDMAGTSLAWTPGDAFTASVTTYVVVALAADPDVSS
ncbi:MAG: mannose-6-phosphate isomerase, class I [Ilumatobacteraceae bacterium]